MAAGYYMSDKIDFNIFKLIRTSTIQQALVNSIVTWSTWTDLMAIGFEGDTPDANEDKN